METETGTDSFYLDEAACAVADTVIDGAGQPEFTVKGDINKDKALDPADTVLLQKWLLAYPDAAPEDWESGDMDQNGLLYAADLSLMKQVLLAQ